MLLLQIKLIAIFILFYIPLPSLWLHSHTRKHHRACAARKYILHAHVVISGQKMSVPSVLPRCIFY